MLPLRSAPTCRAVIRRAVNPAGQEMLEDDLKSQLLDILQLERGGIPAPRIGPAQAFSPVSAQIRAGIFLAPPFRRTSIGLAHVSCKNATGYGDWLP